MSGLETSGSHLLYGDDVVLLASLSPQFHGARRRFASNVKLLGCETVLLGVRSWSQLLLCVERSWLRWLSFLIRMPPF